MIFITFTTATGLFNTAFLTPLESLCPSTLSSILRRLSESSEDKVNIDTACDPQPLETKLGVNNFLVSPLNYHLLTNVEFPRLWNWRDLLPLVVVGSDRIQNPENHQNTLFGSGSITDCNFFPWISERPPSSKSYKTYKPY